MPMKGANLGDNSESAMTSVVDSDENSIFVLTGMWE